MRVCVCVGGGGGGYMCVMWVFALQVQVGNKKYGNNFID